MWSLTQRLGVTLVHNLQILKSAAVPVTVNALPKSRLFCGLSWTATITNHQLGVSGVLSESRRLLQPASSPLVQLANGFKIKGRLKRRCKDCYFVVRQERTYVMCKSHGRHKQMSMKKSEKNSWILTDATQSKVRLW